MEEWATAEGGEARARMLEEALLKRWRLGRWWPLGPRSRQPRAGGRLADGTRRCARCAETARWQAQHERARLWLCSAVFGFCTVPHAEYGRRGMGGRSIDFEKRKALPFGYTKKLGSFKKKPLIAHWQRRTGLAAAIAVAPRVGMARDEPPLPCELP